MSEKITTIKKMVIRADKVWVLDSVVNFYPYAFDGCLEPYWNTDITSGWDQKWITIMLYFEADQDNFNFYQSGAWLPFDGGEVSLYGWEYGYAGGGDYLDDYIMGDDNYRFGTTWEEFLNY